MKIFTPLYDKVLQWAAHPKATRYLGGMSFAESSFFPVPPDVMLMPMSLAKPQQAFYFAWIATLFSALGGLLGYAIGYFAMDMIQPLIVELGYQPKLDAAQAFFDQYGVWVVFIAGFSPIPYKVFTISAGASAMALLPFIIASLVGRGARFYLVAALMRWGGASFEPVIRKWVDWIGWALVALIVLAIGWHYLK
ncbi:YqaA family protein [Thiomicrorhabdus xiamenensis]|uniref:DedA family protein n=1 Tax=Thiomicrorhabdus xiamenensis TaxID=2739063 RepID=A0A7D4NNZ4_9GAMM|nr:YqaA family protein [Thiomicrorhabdus xiamenensis]QKI89193.1 DedA family protein [Thiomicrorhabdus xiamenensis]